VDPNIPENNLSALERAFKRDEQRKITLLNDPHMLAEKEVLGRLSISKEELYSRIGKNEILVLFIMRQKRFPDWQFDPKILASSDLPKVLKILSAGGQLSRLRFFETPQPSLGGALPIDLLREGKGSRLFRAAQTWLAGEQGGH